MKRCDERVQCRGMQFYRTRQCRRKAVVVYEGKWYCSQHNPVEVAKRKIVQNRARIKKLKEDNKRYIQLLAARQIPTKKHKSEKGPCVVSSDYCDYPANLEPLKTAPCKCYACGLRVCANDSFVRFDKMAKRKTRACLNCIEDDPTRWGFKDYDELIEEWNTVNGAFDAPKKLL